MRAGAGGHRVTRGQRVRQQEAGLLPVPRVQLRQRRQVGQGVHRAGRVSRRAGAACHVLARVVVRPGRTAVLGLRHVGDEVGEGEAGAGGGEAGLQLGEAVLQVGGPGLVAGQVAGARQPAAQVWLGQVGVAAVQGVGGAGEGRAHGPRVPEGGVRGVSRAGRGEAGRHRGQRGERAQGEEAGPRGQVRAQARAQAGRLRGQQGRHQTLLDSSFEILHFMQILYSPCC